jgi:hypothetical protein
MYGKSAGNWLYAKSVWAKKDGVWARAWTDCRRHDAGGRDWGTTTLSPVYSGSCASITYQIPTRYTKDGCPSYDVPGSNVAAPNCAGCTGTPYVSNSCDGCGSITTTPGTGGCPDSSSGSCGSWNYIDPFSGSSPSSVSVGGVTYNQSLYGYTDYSSCGYCQINSWDLYQCSATSAYKVVYAGCFSLEFC